MFLIVSEYRAKHCNDLDLYLGADFTDSCQSAAVITNPSTMSPELTDSSSCTSTPDMINTESFTDLLLQQKSWRQGLGLPPVILLKTLPPLPPQPAVGSRVIGQ
jgi:hypothetical protein